MVTMQLGKANCVGFEQRPKLLIFTEVNTFKIRLEPKLRIQDDFAPLQVREFSMLVAHIKLQTKFKPKLVLSRGVSSGKVGYDQIRRLPIFSPSVPSREGIRPQNGFQIYHQGLMVPLDCLLHGICQSCSKGTLSKSRCLETANYFGLEGEATRREK